MSRSDSSEICPFLARIPDCTVQPTALTTTGRFQVGRQHLQSSAHEEAYLALMCHDTYFIDVVHTLAALQYTVQVAEQRTEKEHCAD